MSAACNETFKPKIVGGWTIHLPKCTAVIPLQLVTVFLCQWSLYNFILIYGFYFILLWT